MEELKVGDIVCLNSHGDEYQPLDLYRIRRLANSNLDRRKSKRVK
jgi:hypothetical protein